MTNATNACGCCEGTQSITPQPLANRPGLSALSYRVGTHSTFLETMRARLSSLNPLRGLTTRASDDPSIALLDAWATVADVLTFYQERIANEGYLRTATERRSVLELARLVGYSLRPGVAASAWLALELDKDYEVTIQPNELKAQSIPGQGEMPQTFENIEPLDARYAWNKLQPRLTKPQMIDTIAPYKGQKRLYVKGISTNLKPNDVVLITEGNYPPWRIYHVAEVNPDPSKNRTLVIFQESTPIKSKNAMLESKKTKCETSYDPLKKAMAGLTKPPSVYPRDALSLVRNIESLFVLPELPQPNVALQPPQNLSILSGEGEATPPLPSNGPQPEMTSVRSSQWGMPSPTADISLHLAGTLDTRLRQSLPVTLANVKVTPDSDIRAYVFRAVARPFGHNAPMRTIITTTKTERGNTTSTSYKEWEIQDPLGNGQSQDQPCHKADKLYLDSEYKIQINGWIFIEGPNIPYRIFLKLSNNKEETEVTTSQQALAAYGISGKSTCLELQGGKKWLTVNQDGKLEDNFDTVRSTVVYCESEELPLAEEPIDDSIFGGEDDLIELDGLYSGLQSGRWVIVSGERDDIVGEAVDEADNPVKVRGIKAAELVMLAEVTQKVKEFDSRPGDQTHTFIKLAKKLEYSYRRDTVTLYGNVIKATHGETRKETLGSGDASQAFQAFTLKQPPLTFIASPKPAGAESTLKVYVNDVQWDEADNPAELAPADREFITKTDDEGKTTVIFGNGQRGARLPTGIENIRAQYRNGIGRVGNVRAEQISQLSSKPLGVKGVINPLRASGGADRESRDTARKNAPLAITALDRLVSVSDYADFARTFAGIGKAVAASITDGKREWVHVTIAGADDIPIDETSDLYRNLLQALHDNGDPYQPVALQTRELLLLVISAKLRILPKYQWEPVATAVRTRLLDTFSFERRELGQDVLLSEVIATIQSVSGVAYVDVDAFGGIPEKKTDTNDEEKPIRRLLTPKEISDAAATFVRQSLSAELPQSRVRVNLADFDEDAMRPAQLAYLPPIPADMLVLNQIK